MPTGKSHHLSVVSALSPAASSGGCPPLCLFPHFRGRQVPASVSVMAQPWHLLIRAAQACDLLAASSPFPPAHQDPGPNSRLQSPLKSPLICYIKCVPLLTLPLLIESEL